MLVLYLQERPDRLRIAPLAAPLPLGVLNHPASSSLQVGDPAPAARRGWCGPLILLPLAARHGDDSRERWAALGHTVSACVYGPALAHAPAAPTR